MAAIKGLDVLIKVGSQVVGGNVMLLSNYQQNLLIQQQNKAVVGQLRLLGLNLGQAHVMVFI